MIDVRGLNQTLHNSTQAKHMKTENMTIQFSTIYNLFLYIKKAKQLNETEECYIYLFLSYESIKDTQLSQSITSPYVSLSLTYRLINADDMFFGLTCNSKYYDNITQDLSETEPTEH